MGLLFGIIFSDFFGTIFEMSENPNMSDAEALGFLSVMGVNYLLIFAISTVTYAFMFAAIYAFMVLRDKNMDTSISEVLGHSIRKVPGLVGLLILIAVTTIIGFMFFILPGIYFAFTLSLAIPIYLFEKTDVFSAYGKSFSLIRDKWWSTFGLLLVTSIMAGIVGYIFAIPFYIVMFGGAFSTATEATNDPEAFLSIFSSWYSTVSMAIMAVGSYLTYMIPALALAFQYFNLVERQEGRGIRTEIDDFESLG